VQAERKSKFICFCRGAAYIRCVSSKYSASQPHPKISVRGAAYIRCVSSKYSASQPHPKISVRGAAYLRCVSSKDSASNRTQNLQSETQPIFAASAAKIVLVGFRLACRTVLKRE